MEASRRYKRPEQNGLFWFCPSTSTTAKVGATLHFVIPIEGEGPAVCVDGETHSRCPKVKLQVPPLRYAPVGMTKWRVAAHLRSGRGGWTESTNRPRS